MPTAKLISITPNYMELLKTACGKPYGNNMSDKGIQKIIESGHLSILEHCYASFDVECSVRVLGQLTRHRHLSFTVKSARGSEFTKVETPNLKGLFECIDPSCCDCYEQQLMDTKDAVEVQEQSIDLYQQAISNGMSYENAAYLLPQGAITSLVVTGNFRAWYEYLPKRLCKRALQEHRELAYAIHLELAKACSEIFERNFMNCANCKEGSCEFK